MIDLIHYKNLTDQTEKIFMAHSKLFQKALNAKGVYWHLNYEKIKEDLDLLNQYVRKIAQIEKNYDKTIRNTDGSIKFKSELDQLEVPKIDTLEEELKEIEDKLSVYKKNMYQYHTKSHFKHFKPEELFGIMPEIQLHLEAILNSGISWLPNERKHNKSLLNPSYDMLLCYITDFQNCLEVINFFGQRQWEQMEKAYNILDTSVREYFTDDFVKLALNPKYQKATDLAVIRQEKETLKDKVTNTFESKSEKNKLKIL